jgi:hypothetical protein
VTRTLGYFLAGAIVGWAALAGIGQQLQGEYGLLCAGVAGLVCIIPTTISLIMTLWSNNKTGSEQLMAVIGGMGLRMVTVLSVSLVVFLNVGEFREDQSRELTFWTFVLISYLATLAWETFLAARSGYRVKPAANGPGGAK